MPSIGGIATMVRPPCSLPTLASPRSWIRRMGPARGVSAARHGFTITELMVVLVILAILALVLVRFLHVDADTHCKPSCGNNQRQIVLAMGVYGNEQDGIWPYRPTLRNGAFAATGRTPDAMATAIATFEFMEVQTGNQMTSKVFACPTARLCHPPLNSANQALDETATTTSNWVSACMCTNALLMPGYCYDWSVPTNANASRVVLADRGFDSLGHKSVSIVCYADNHVGNLKQSYAFLPRWPMTFPFASSTTPASVYCNTDASGTVPDNIYDGAGDDGDESAGGRGSTTRAWVR